MRKISVLFATIGLVAVGALFPVTSAQASAACDTAWHGATWGHFYAYNYANCSGKLGSTASYDGNWGNSSGPFQGGDTNKASSILHKGESGMAVKVYDGTSYTGAFACIKKSEYYASSLYDNYLWAGPGNGQVPASNTISSHEWVWESDCDGSFLD